jgi:hypothetical protein
MSRRQNDPSGYVGEEVRVAQAQLAAAIHWGDDKKVREARAAYWRALANDMERRAKLVAAAAEELETAS